MYVSNDTATVREMNMVIYEFDHGEKKEFDTDDENLLSAYENTFYYTCGYDRSWDRLMPVLFKLIGMNKFFFTPHKEYVGYDYDFNHEHGVGEEIITVRLNIYRHDCKKYIYGVPFGKDPLKAVYYSVYESIKKMQ